MIDQLDRETRETLERFGFDEERFRDLRARVRDGSLSPASNVVSGVVEPPRELDVVRLPDRADDTEARAAGLEALRRGELAIVVLTGGMATRFGGGVKGTVEAVDGRSFLELKLAQSAEVAAALDAPIPAALMTSFATDAEVRRFVAEHELPEPLFFAQSISLRLDPGGGLFHGEDWRASLYSPGHGDFLSAFRDSSTLGQLRDRGVRTVLVSNVDNLGARVDPAVLGVHRLSGRPVTAEVVAKRRDSGGAPARVDGRLQLVEGLCFPPDFDQNTIPVFNVNTLTVDLDALDREFDLTWLYVEKTVEGRPAVQLERLYHEVTRFLPTTYLEVPRSGPRGRFFPVKTPEDLEDARDALRELVAASTLA